MRNTPSFGEAVAAWFRRVNGEGRRRRMSLNAISEKSGVARTTLYRIEAGEGADEATLAAVADALGVDRPVVTRTLQLEPAALQEPQDALGWIGEAQAALDRAAGLLRGQVIGPTPDEVAVSSRAVAEHTGKVAPAPPPGRARRAGKGKG